MTKYFIKGQTLEEVADVIKDKIKLSDTIAFGKIQEKIESFEAVDKTIEIINKTITSYTNNEITNIRDNVFTSCTKLISVNFPVCTDIGNSAFTSCTNLTSVNFPVCTDIGNGTFRGCINLTSVSFPVCTSIGSDTFADCTNLASVSFPVCSIIGNSAFTYCHSLTYINYPSCTNIYPNAFYYCGSLTSVSFPACTNIGAYAFYQCLKLTSVSFPACTNIGAYAFYSCSKLNSVSFPACISIGYGAFNYCTGLVSINSPVCKYIGTSTFQNCTNLTYVNFPDCVNIQASTFVNCKNLAYVSIPACTSIANYAFQNCTNLTSISLPVCSYIWDYVFVNCTNLINLTLLSSKVCTLRTSTAFQSTPIASGTGYIYVPSSLVASYKAYTNWAYYSSQILPYGAFMIGYMEDFNLFFDKSKQVNIPVSNANENATYNITSSDDNVATISDIVTTMDLISFNVNAGRTEGQSVIRVEASCGGYTWIRENTVSVREEMRVGTYVIKPVDGAAYGFELNANGYYESTNKNKHSSAAVCKLIFNTGGVSHLYLDCINSGQSRYDYGLISNVDAALTTSYTADSSGVFKNFMGQSSTSVQTVDMGAVEAGEHFIYIKFIKNGSASSGNDSLQFKVRIE